VTFNVDEAFTAPASAEVPVTERLPIVAPFADRLVVEAFVEDSEVNVAPVAERFVVEALVRFAFVE
jgi:hypothetical protein